MWVVVNFWIADNIDKSWMSAKGNAVLTQFHNIFTHIFAHFAKHFQLIENAPKKQTVLIYAWNFSSFSLYFSAVVSYSRSLDWNSWYLFCDYQEESLKISSANVKELKFCINKLSKIILCAWFFTNILPSIYFIYIKNRTHIWANHSIQ